MNKIDKKLNKYKEINNQKPLFSDKDIDDLIKNSVAKNQLTDILPNNSKRYIMFASSSLLIVVSLFFLMTTQKEFNSEIKEETKLVNKNDALTEKLIQNKSTTDKKAKNIEANNGDTIKISDSAFIVLGKGNNDSVNSAGYTVYNVKTIVKDLMKNDKVLMKDEKLNEWVKQNKVEKENILNDNKIPGMFMLELTAEEMKKFDIQFNDTALYVFEEIFVDKGDKVRFKDILTKFRYPVDNAPFFYRRFQTFKKNIFGGSMKTDIIPYGGETVNDYSKTLQVAYHTFDSDNRIGSWSYHQSPIMAFQGGIFSELFETERKLYTTMLYTPRNSTEENKEIVENANLKWKNVTNNILEYLVPVYFEWKGKDFTKKFIFWYVPNKEFIETIPERYRETLKKELEAIKIHEEMGIPLFEACKGIDNQQTIYEFCRLTSGALEITGINPNPVSDNAELSIILREKRKLGISIHDLSGNTMYVFLLGKEFSPGEHKFNLDFSQYPANNFYLISVKTDKEEIVSKRIIKN